MAKVPTYEGGIDVAPLDIPRQQGLPASVFTSGTSLTDVAGKAIMSAAGFFEEQSKIRDADMVNRAEVGYASEEQDFRAQMSERVGNNAHGITKETEQWSQTKFREISSSLENDRQRRAFEARFAQRAINLRGDALKHEVTQNKASYLESRSSRLAVNIRDAVSDPTQVSQKLAENAAIIKDLQGLNGWDDDTAKLKEMEYATMMHGQVMQSLAKTPDKARAYYEAHKEEIDPTKREVFEKTFEEGDRVIRTQTTVDFVRNKKMSDSEAMAYIEQNLSGEDEKMAKIEFKQRRSDEIAFQRQTDDKNFKDAWTIAIDNKQGRKGIPSDLWTSLTPEDRSKITGQLEHDADRAYTLATRGAAVSRKTDQKLYGEIYQQAISDPQGFLARDLNRDLSGLSDGDYQELLRLKKTVSDAANKPEKIKRIQTVDAQIKSMVDAAGIPAVSSTKAIADKRAIAERTFRDAVLQEAAAKGKEFDQLTEQEITQIGDRLLMKGVVTKDWAIDQTKHAFELTADEKGRFNPDNPESYYRGMTLKDIPESEVKDIREAIYRKGKVPTPQEILRAYKLSKGIR